MGRVHERTPVRDQLIHDDTGDVSVAARPLTLVLVVPGAILLGVGSYHYISSVHSAWAFEHPDSK